ncbi:hypothetical protein O9992_12930 [Vibrio lentus]|nr:hypothetical protein [Vibrio lentus]
MNATTASYGSWGRWIGLQWQALFSCGEPHWTRLLKFRGNLPRRKEREDIAKQ